MPTPIDTAFPNLQELGIYSIGMEKEGREIELLVATSTSKEGHPPPPLRPSLPLTTAVAGGACSRQRWGRGGAGGDMRWSGNSTTSKWSAAAITGAATAISGVAGCFALGYFLTLSRSTPASSESIVPWGEKGE